MRWYLGNDMQNVESKFVYNSYNVHYFTYGWTLNKNLNEFILLGIDDIFKLKKNLYNIKIHT